MSKLHEISCRNCGSSISLNEEWDRTPQDFRPQDRVLHRCLMCGGEMQFYKRWIDTPSMHPECSDERWSDVPCSMCFGPMTVSGEPGKVRRFHERCRPEFWYERACEICHEGMRVHVDWQNPPTCHRGCEGDDWYEKGCKYCGTALKVHVSWQNPPAAHPECEPVHHAEEPLSPYPSLDVGENAIQASDEPQPEAMVWENGGITEDVELAYEDDGPRDEEPAEPTEVYEPAVASAFTATDEPAPAEEAYLEDDIVIERTDETMAAGAEYWVAAPESGIEAAYIGNDEPDMTPPFEVVNEETPQGDFVEEPSAPEFLFAEPAESGSDDDGFVGEYSVNDQNELEAMGLIDQAPQPEESSNINEPTSHGYVAEGETRTGSEGEQEHYCTRCGKRETERINAFHLSKVETSRQDEGICRSCKHDLMLVGGAVATLRKNLPFELRVVSELRTVTFPVTVVTNAETGQPVAEVMLMDDGVFSADRAAVVCDAITQEPISKTVFGQKGLFSSLRTAETYDVKGNLLHHARHGGELTLSDYTTSEHAVQVDRNRFFFKKSVSK
jgi:hypothetical protein